MSNGQHLFTVYITLTLLSGDPSMFTTWWGWERSSTIINSNGLVFYTNNIVDLLA